MSDHTEEGYYGHVEADLNQGENSSFDHVGSWEEWKLYKAALLRWIVDKEAEWVAALDNDALEREHESDLAWFYLSFSSDTGFLGGCYVEAEDRPSAITTSWAIGANPGGEAQVVGPISGELMNRNVPADKRGRLLTREELDT